MSLIPIYTKEEVQARIEAIELLKPNFFNEKTLKELVQFRITTQEEAQNNVNREEPYVSACGCLGGPRGCSMCHWSLTMKSFAYRFHLYMHYFYKED